MVLERDVLARFKNLRVRGEWRRYSARMLAFIRDHAIPILSQDLPSAAEMYGIRELLCLIYQRPVGVLDDLYPNDAADFDPEEDEDVEEIPADDLIPIDLGVLAKAWNLVGDELWLPGRPRPAARTGPDRSNPAKPHTIKGGRKAILAAYKAARGIPLTASEG